MQLWSGLRIQSENWNMGNYRTINDLEQSVCEFDLIGALNIFGFLIL